MVDYDPFSEEVIQNPHPIYKKLRAEDPCHYLEKFDTWALSRFHDIWEASMDAEHYTATKGTTPGHLLTKIQPVTPMLNMMDPPTHTELRSKIAPFFRPGRVRKLESQIQGFVDEAFADVEGRKEADLFNDFATKVSVKVACVANGFPMEDSDYLNGLVWRFFAREESEEGGSSGMTQDGVAAMMELTQYFAELIQKRRKAGESGDTPVDVVVNTEVGGRKFTDEEAGSHLSMFMIGGAETFPKTFASMVLRLAEHPEQRAEAARDASLIPDTYQEALRYDMPTQFLMRVVTKEHQIHGKTLRPGQPIMFLYPSANRDEREFEDPDRFDIHRKPPRILTFGHGIHACIGLHYAKAEGRLCLKKLLDYAPEYEVKTGELKRICTEFVQGWEAMPVRFNR